MFKKIIFVFFALFAFSSAIEVKAQTFDRAYQDYLYTRTIYETSFKEYEASKNAYLGNPTLSLKDEAKKDALIMLRNRDQLYITYITALQVKLNDLTQLDPAVKTPIVEKLVTESKWYQDHKATYSESDQIETLFDKSDEAKNRYQKGTVNIVNEALFDITLGEEQGLRIAHDSIYTELKNIINQKVTEGKLTLTPFNNWFNDIDNTITVLKNNEKTATDALEQVYASEHQKDKAFENAFEVLAESIRPLSQFNQYLTEVLAYIQNND